MTNMTDEQRKSLALEYFSRLDRGEDFLGLFAPTAQVLVPKWGIATGTGEIAEAFTPMGGKVAAITHGYAYFNYVHSGDVLVVEGTSSGRTADGAEWQANGTTHRGRWCDVFEIRGGLIQRLFIYLDPDYGDADAASYPWLPRS